MKIKPLTDAELLVLGLVAEMPRHGYELEQVIEKRGMREWSQIGFSSIYFVLGKLETAGLVTAEATAGSKARKAYTITQMGRETLIARALEALATYRPVYSSLLLGMVHWPILTREAALQALEVRAAHVDQELTRLERVRFQRQPLPDYVEALFDFSSGQLAAERTWIGQTLDYLQTKP
jgi:DNA-binding PadR family transcriptional regulator